MRLNPDQSLTAHWHHGDSYYSYSRLCWLSLPSPASPCLENLLQAGALPAWGVRKEVTKESLHTGTATFKNCKSSLHSRESQVKESKARKKLSHHECSRVRDSRIASEARRHAACASLRRWSQLTGRFRRQQEVFTREGKSQTT